MLITRHPLIVLLLSAFQKKSKKLLAMKNIITNVFKIQGFNSIICGYFCMGFIDFYIQRQKSDGFY